MESAEYKQLLKDIDDALLSSFKKEFTQLEAKYIREVPQLQARIEVLEAKKGGDDSKLADLSTRLAVLEEARKVQKQINAQFLSPKKDKSLLQKLLNLV